MNDISAWHWAVVLLIVVLIFGTRGIGGPPGSGPDGLASGWARAQRFTAEALRRWRIGRRA